MSATLSIPVPVASKQAGVPLRFPDQQLLPMLISGGMPTLPGYVFRLNHLLKSDVPDMSAVCGVIRTDASLTAQVLRLANLYLLESQTPIFSVEQAIAEIGPQRLRTMLMTCPLMDCAGNPQQWSTIQTFWQHSYMTAVLAETIAEIVGYPNLELAYTAALIHNIGDLPLMMLARNDGRKSLSGLGMGDESAFVRQLPHYEVGRRLAIAWKFPASLVEVCAAHHHPETARHDPMLLGIVVAAAKFCQSSGLELGGLPRQLLASSSDYDLEEIFATLPQMTAEQERELGEVLARQFKQMMAGLEFNSSGLLKAASEASALAS
ncbi:MAG: metal-dependent phosphohydrolase [Acidobacteriaceae bacterium]|nr:metal-dependent phosphohydrolase [Acidobacteriaceae bacterium]